MPLICYGILWSWNTTIFAIARVFASMMTHISRLNYTAILLAAKSGKHTGTKNK